MKGSRCRDRGANPVCPEELNDPVASVEEVTNVSKNSKCMHGHALMHMVYIDV